MTAAVSEGIDQAALARARAAFEENYPRIDRLARRQHRHLRGELREDAVAETVGWTWKTFLAKSLAGEDPVPLIPSLVHFGARHLRQGELLGRVESKKDLLSRSSKARGGYYVTSLNDEDQLRRRAAGMPLPEVHVERRAARQPGPVDLVG